MTASTQEIKTFYHAQVEQALENCQEKHTALYMPEVADKRIQGVEPWDEWRTTPSIKATGKTKQGNAVVVYAHVPNWLANPANIRAAKEQGLVNYAARLPQDEFQRLLDAEDKQRVWVVDHEVLRKAPSGRIPLTQALEHPQTIPFLGGQERAERYLPKHAKAYDTETIGVRHTDDLTDESPLARLLFLGNNSSLGLLGNDSLDGSGLFAGVRNASAEGAAQKIVATPKIIAPTLETVLERLHPFIAPVSREAFEAELRKLYEQ